MKYYIFLYNRYIPLEKSKKLFHHDEFLYENYKLKDYCYPILLKHNNIYLINISYHNTIYYTKHWWDKYFKRYNFLQSENFF